MVNVARVGAQSNLRSRFVTIFIRWDNPDRGVCRRPQTLCFELTAETRSEGHVLAAADFHGIFLLLSVPK